MCIQRGELSKETRLYYGIDKEETKLPDLSSDEMILQQGKRLVQGENERMLKGGNRIHNPSLALVSINLEKFKESCSNIENHQQTQKRASEELIKYREVADEYILKLWNLLEAHFECDNEVKFRTACSAWGISYVYRKSELKRMEEQRYATSISPTLKF